MIKNYKSNFIMVIFGLFLGWDKGEDDFCILDKFQKRIFLREVLLKFLKIEFMVLVLGFFILVIY